MVKKIKNFFITENRSLSYNYTGILRFIPLIIAGGFFFCTILLVAIGPIDWCIYNNFKFYGFTLSCLAALVCGYLLAVYKKPFKSRQHTPLKINVSALLYICVAVYLILYIPTVKVSTGKWYPDVYTGITKTGLAYQLAKYYSQFSPKALFYARILCAPFTISIMPITFFYKSRLSKPAFISGVVAVCLNVALSIAQGVTKTVADFVIQIVLLLIILMFSVKKKGKKEIALHFTKFIAAVLAVCIAFFAYYSNAMANRLSTDYYLGENSAKLPEELREMLGDKSALNGENLNGMITGASTFSVGVERENSVFNKILPAKIRPMFNYLTSYFCHGYYGLSLAMEQDFTSSYGFGFSDFIRHNLSKLFGGEAFEEQMYSRTYMSKLVEEGWEVGLCWTTFFVYPASDISFIGVIFLVFIIGFLFSLSWKDAIKGGNPFALVAFFCFCTMIFYFSANNQMFQTGENCVGFIAILILWLVSRIVLNIKGKKVNN